MHDEIQTNRVLKIEENIIVYALSVEAFRTVIREVHHLLTRWPRPALCTEIRMQSIIEVMQNLGSYMENVQ